MAANPKSGNENVDAAINEENFWKQYNEWEALTAGKGGMPKNPAKAGQIVTQLIKGVYLVKFGPADGFNPQTPGEFLEAFYKTSTLKSDKNRLGGSGFFRTKRENNKLMASFLTEQPDQMKQDIEKNPQLIFISTEEITPEKFIAHVKAGQESLRNTSVAGAQDKADITVKTMSPSVVKTVPQAGDTEVDPSLKEITVTFSKDMLTDRMWAVCQISKETFPKTGNNIHYLQDKRTCVVPVELEPEKTYALWFNQGRFNSFRDTENNPAVPYLLVFRTGKGK